MASMVLAALCTLVPAAQAEAAGDGTYQFNWNQMGCTLTVNDSHVIYQGATVVGYQKLTAWAVNGGDKIGRIKVEWELVVPDDNGLWVRQEPYSWETGVNKKRTSPAAFGYKVNRNFTDVSKPVYQAKVIFKITWRKWHGKGPVGFWKTKKKTSDLYPDSVVTDFSGSLVFQPKNWVWGPTCSVRHQ